jgi:hypothetical protein
VCKYSYINLFLDVLRLTEKWRLDEDSEFFKFFCCSLLTEVYTELTFIILARQSVSYTFTDQEGIAKLPMVGDVNLFLKGMPPHLQTNLKVSRSVAEDDEEEDEFEAELEIMIAG